MAPHKLRRNHPGVALDWQEQEYRGLYHQVLGHSNYQTTAKHYVRANDASRRQVAATMDEFLKDLLVFVGLRFSLGSGRSNRPFTFHAS